MNREARKKELRNNIVTLPAADDWEDEDDFGDSEEEVRGAGSRTILRRVLWAILIVVLFALLGYAWYTYQNQYRFEDYEVTWEKSMRYENDDVTEAADASYIVSESSFINFVYFGDNMLKYTKDGATYIDASGKTIWTESYEMRSPIVSVNGDFVAIADQQGNQIYICDTNGNTGVAKTQLPITKVAVSAKGVVAAIVEDSTASYVLYYRKDGESLGINIKMLLSGDGYPVDIALSPDGTQIVMAVSYIENGQLKSKVVFYDFSEIGKNVENRFLGGFEDDFEGAMVARVRYLNDNTVCVFSDKGISFISVKNVIPDTNVITVPVDDMIESIFYSDKYAGVVVDNTSGNPSRIEVYDTDGKQVASFEEDFSYSGVQIDEDWVILYNEEACVVYNLKGNKKFEGVFDFGVSCVRSAKNRLNSLIIAGSEKMQEIKLK